MEGGVRMKRFVLAAAILGLASCQEQRAGDRDINSLLKRQDAAACAHPDVASKIYQQARFGSASDEVVISELDRVVLLSADEKTGRLNCRANWVARKDDRTATLELDYSVQLDVTGKQVVVDVTNVQDLRTLFSAFSSKVRGAETNPAPPEEQIPQGGYKWEREYTPEQEAEQKKWREDLDVIVAEGRRLCDLAKSGPLTGSDLSRAKGTAREIGSPQTDEDAAVQQCLFDAIDVAG